MFKSRLLYIFMALCVLFFTLFLYLWWQAHAPQILAKQEVMIAKGSSSSSIALRLEKEHIIQSALLFRWWTRLSGDAARLKPGLYHFTGKLSMLDVLEVLKKGEVQQFKVTIPEGLRTDEMLVLLAKRSNTSLKAWQKAQQKITQKGAFEGVFLPETYLYSKPIDPEAILRQMHEARAQIEAELAQTFAWSNEQVIRNRIMASIVEKETALPHERVWVSAAIHNRIRLHMPLQMDPTVIYGIYQSQGAFSGNIRRQDLRADTPWNTYTRKGLPRTPICNPGAESLRAAALPADVDYLYFVADGTGGHAFATTLAQHNANVRKWIRMERKMKH